MHCHLTSNFETCPPNEPQMTVDTTRWKVHQMYSTPSPESQISTRFRKSAGNDPRMAWTVTCTEWPQNDLEHNDVNGTVCMLYQCPLVPNFKQFCLFLVAGHFDTSVLNEPKWPWTQQSQGTPCMLYQYPRVSNFNQFRSTASSFRLVGYAGTRVATDRKMTPRTRVHFIYVLLQVPPRSKFHSAVPYARSDN